MSNASIVESLKARLEKLNSLQLDEVERLVRALEFNNCWEPIVDPLIKIDWPHAPTHRIGERGVYLVTAGTLQKTHLFSTCTSLDLMQNKLLTLAKRFQWHLEAWACFANHYHFIANAEEATCGLDVFIQQFHSQTANELNAIDHTIGRTVWANYFESKLTYQRSYLARLNYVHQNAVRHKLVRIANTYKWCSAAWFESTATPAQVKSIYGFKTDRIRVIDDF